MKLINGFTNFPIPGDANDIYVDTSNETQYRWADNGYKVLAARGYTAGRNLTASANLAATDNGTLINANHATVAIALTIQNDATAAWPSQSIIMAYQDGAAAVSFAAGSGVTIRPGVAVPAAQQDGMYGVMRVGANKWITF